MAERKVLRDAVRVGGIDHDSLAEAATAFGALGLEQVTATRFGTHYFTAGSDLEPFGHGFSCFNTFGATHKIYWAF
jgi:hypothetical protein